MFKFTVSCPLKGCQETKQTLAEQLGCSVNTIRLYTEILTKIQQRSDLHQDEKTVSLALRLDEGLMNGENPTDIVNQLIKHIAKISRLVNFKEVEPILVDEIDQTLVYQLCRGGLLSLKLLHTQSVFSPKTCSMETQFIGKL